MVRILLVFVLAACAVSRLEIRDPRAPNPESRAPFALVLGIAQDGGYPQAGCNRPDCEKAWRDPKLRKLVASLAIVDPATRERWIIDATPDFPEQLRKLDEIAPGPLPGILITHAHIGHYLGLAHLGREVLGARAVKVYAMPRMSAFLRNNGPWDQLIRLGNIELVALEDGRELRLNERIAVTPLQVPHRDEYSETAGFIVRGPGKAVLWLPDIDKWEKWPASLESVLERVDVAYVDGTFYSAGELPGRDMSEIPHPLMVETLARLARSPLKAKIRFIHLNQSNPALGDKSLAPVAVEGERTPL